MEFQFTPMTMDYLKEIDSWNYEGFVEQVLMTPYFKSMEETGQLIGPGGCDGFVALADGQPAGLFEFVVADDALEIGLALKPELIGRGFGADYVRQGIDFGRRHYQTELHSVMLTVELANKAAIRVYEKAGFEQLEQNEDGLAMKLSL